MTFYVNDKGKISEPSMAEFKEELAKHPNQEVDVGVKKRKRTIPQNNVLHWALRIFANGLTDLGYKITFLDLKYELKDRGFFGYNEYETKEGTQRRPKDTSELNVKECSDAFQFIQMAAMQYDIIIPDPNEVEYRRGRNA